MSTIQTRSPGFVLPSFLRNHRASAPGTGTRTRPPIIREPIVGPSPRPGPVSGPIVPGQGMPKPPPGYANPLGSNPLGFNLPDPPRQLAMVNMQPLGAMRLTGRALGSAPYRRAPVVNPRPVPTVPLASAVPAPGAPTLVAGGSLGVTVQGAPGGPTTISVGGVSAGGVTLGSQNFTVNLPAGVDPSAILAAIIGALGGKGGGSSCGC